LGWAATKSPVSSSAQRRWASATRPGQLVLIRPPSWPYQLWQPDHTLSLACVRGKRLG